MARKTVRGMVLGSSFGGRGGECSQKGVDVGYYWEVSKAHAHQGPEEEEPKRKRKEGFKNTLELSGDRTKREHGGRKFPEMRESAVDKNRKGGCGHQSLKGRRREGGLKGETQK